ncbi:MAG: response regulator [Deltaproteobacteria bacterium]|nr:response regulator [Deltaproteobacteria bacterium]
MSGPKKSPVAALAASVAHDLNNPLAYMVSNLRYCTEMLAKPGPIAEAQLVELREALADVGMGVEKMRGIVGALKSLARAEESLASDPAPAAAPRVATSGGRASIAVIDDDPLIGQAIVRTLGGEHEVVTFTDAREALKWLDTHQPALILCDIHMPEMSGPELYSRLGETKSYPRERIVFITGNAQAESTAHFLDSVENARLFKPFDPDSLKAVVKTFAR